MEIINDIGLFYAMRHVQYSVISNYMCICVEDQLTLNKSV